MTSFTAPEETLVIGGEPCEVMQRLVWCVDPSRGDLYVVTSENTDVLVQLVDGGIADRPSEVLGAAMPVLVSVITGKVMALPVQDGSGWSRCQRLRD